MTDPITDMLNRIRNAQAVFHPTVDIPFSGIKYEIARLLERNGFIESVEKKGRKDKMMIRIVLKYEGAGIKRAPFIQGLRRISKPGQRIYLPYSGLKPIRGGHGIAVISTSKGLMTDKEARKQKVGGEVVAEIW